MKELSRSLAMNNIGRRYAQLDREYQTSRDSLFSDYESNRDELLARYRVDRARLFKRYSEEHDSAEYRHGIPCRPLDYGYLSGAEAFDKDIAVIHAQPLKKFEAVRLDVDSSFVSKLAELYKAYAEQRGALDCDYETKRVSLYAGYREKRNRLDFEVRSAGEPS